MTQSEQPETQPPHVRVALEVAEEHLILQDEHRQDLGPFVDLGEFHLTRPLDQDLDKARHGALKRACLEHLATRGIPHKKSHLSAVAAVNRISERLCDRLTGTTFEVIQHHNPKNFDLA